MPDLGPILSRLEALETALSDVRTQIGDIRTRLVTYDRDLQDVRSGVHVLASRPVYARCRAAIFGIPVSCRLEP